MAEKGKDMSNVELTVTKARNIQTAGGEWLKAEYTVKVANLAPEELDAARTALEAKVDVWLSELKPTAPTVAPATAPTAPTPQPVTVPTHPSTFFPKDLADLLNFEDQGDHWVVKPRQFLGSENFAKIAAIVREHKGEYISAGRDSHFKMLKT